MVAEMAVVSGMVLAEADMKNIILDQDDLCYCLILEKFGSRYGDGSEFFQY